MSSESEETKRARARQGDKSRAAKYGRITVSSEHAEKAYWQKKIAQINRAARNRGWSR